MTLNMPPLMMMMIALTGLNVSFWWMQEFVLEKSRAACDTPECIQSGVYADFRCFSWAGKSQITNLKLASLDIMGG